MIIVHNLFFYSDQIVICIFASFCPDIEELKYKGHHVNSGHLTRPQPGSGGRVNKRRVVRPT